MHGRRYTPAPSYPLVSHSMLSVPNGTSPRQRHHHEEREVAVSKARSLQVAREVVPHRLHWAFYMKGQPAEISDKDQLTPEELKLLRELTLSQNPTLYYGAGVRSGTGQILKEVAKFERKLLEAFRRTGRGATPSTYEDEVDLDGHVADVGRYSRLSRTLTPGSPILERDEPEIDHDVDTPPPSPLQETFLTDSNPTQPM